MKTATLREKYLAFFESKGCKRVPSSSLIPDDPSLLLTSAGMVQFKPYFLQQKQLEAPYVGTTTVQKCVRTTDIDIIGTTGRHLSFFEMMGNFSFGAYFKQEMCAWALEFSLEVLGFAPEKLHFTVYEEDDETIGIWESLGVDPTHITKLGKKDNFWVAGDTGPCGPCSELYYDQGEAFGCGSPTCAPGCDCDRFIEFWNCVFTQYDLQADGSLVNLPKKNIDTGLGLERTAALLQGVRSNYDTDILRGLIAVGERLAKVSYASSFAGESATATTLDPAQLRCDLSLRILADHSRAATFLIGDGVLPSNEGRGYVLRRLMRRAMRHGLLLGIEAPFLGNFVRVVIAEMGEVYPEIQENRSLIERVIEAEEERFAATLRNGQGFLDEHLAQLAAGGELDGAAAFELHDRFGFPIELTVEIANEQGFGVDRVGFDACMEDQRTRGREHVAGDAWSHESAVYETILREQGPTRFVGYETTEATARIVALVVDGELVSEVAAEPTLEGAAEPAGANKAPGFATGGTLVELVLDQTPFYAERGGQVGDTGLIGEYCAAPQDTPLAPATSAPQDTPAASSAPATPAAPQGMSLTPVFYVQDTQLRAGGVYAHCGYAATTLRVGDTVSARVDSARRARIERNHTATHLLHHALQCILGEHVKQAGSLVAPERLRFDFTHFEAITPEQLSEVELLVNQLIAQDGVVSAYETSLDAARESGVTALFGEKYGSVVRVLEAGPASRELCGGTHVKHTAAIGLFKIASEGSVGANVRRIEAFTSLDALEAYRTGEQQLAAAAHALKTTPAELASRAEALLRQSRELEHELAQLKKAGAADELSQHLSEAVSVGSSLPGQDGAAYQLLVTRLDGLDGGQLRETADYLRQKLGAASAVVVGSVAASGTPSLLAAATQPAVEAGFDAGGLMRELAPLIDGRGGGKAGMAQAGGKNAAGLNAALDKARSLLVAQP